MGPPLSEALTTLARSNPQIVESVIPAGVLSEGRIRGIQPEGFYVTHRCTAGVVQHIASARQRGGGHPMQIFGINTHAFPGSFERALKVGLLLQQPFVPGAFVVVHLGARTVQSFGVVFFRDRTSDRYRLPAQDSTFSKPLGDTVLNHLADRAKLFANGLRFPNQRFENNIRFALLIAKISADDLLGWLELPIDAPVSLFQPVGVPRQIN